MRISALSKVTVIASMLLAMLTLSSKVFAEDIEIYLNALLKEKEKARVMLMFDTSGSMQLSAGHGEYCAYLREGRRYNSFKYTACTGTVPSDSADNKCYVYGSWTATPCEKNKSRLIVAQEAVNEVIDGATDVEFGIGVFKDYTSHIVAGIGTKTNAELKAVINGLNADDGTPITDSAFQVYRYFSGGNVFEKSSLSSNRDTSIENGNVYISPFANLTGPGGSYQPRCDNNAYFIMMTDGDPSGNSSYHDAAGPIATLWPDDKYTKAKYKYNDAGDTTELGSNFQHFPRLAEYMAKNDVYSKDTKVNNVYTYTIGFGGAMSPEGKGMLKAAADKGKGKYYDTDDPTQLNANLKATLNQILELSGNFTSPSVAASQSDNTRTKDFVYYSLFSPTGSTRWNGNIKKLKISGHTVVDQTDSPAINDKGEIDKHAKTFWLDYNPSTGDAPGPDGGNVALGGLNAQIKITSPVNRKIFTDVGNSDFKSENSSVLSNIKLALNEYYGGGASEQQAKDLINWMRGIESGSGDDIVLRQHILGDALHSKPAAITYEGSDGDKTHLLFGTNAGFVHFFEDTSATQATEVWAFIPSELFSIQPALMDNAAGKLYGMDLTPTIYHDDSNGDGKVNAGEKVWAFIGMRRGGSTYYALDISNRTAPKLLWSKGKAAYPSLGQTWSQPKVVYVNHPSYAKKPLLVFGAGYDKKQFEEGAANTVGAGIYLVDAETGNKVWSTDDISFDGKDSIVGRIATLDSDYDGYTDRLYAADTGGKIWRIDLAGTNPADWSAFEFASLPGNFFYQPEVARSYYSKVTSYSVDGEVVNATRMTVPFEAIVVGSGNRTTPMDTSNSDKLFMVRDTNVITKSYKTDAPDPIKLIDLMEIDPNTFGSLTNDPARFIGKEFEFAKKGGWAYSLTGVGEKALAKPAIIGGVAYFPTFMASTTDSSSCSLTGGEGRLYAFHLHYAVNIYENAYTVTGDSIPPTPELVYSEDSDENSQFLLIGIGAGENNSGIIKAKSINDSAVPELVCDENGKNCSIKLVGDFVGFKTHRSYMYREATNKVN
ncbi:pilus assembly protein [Pseudoalteromonas spongiae]|uniref:pilus assembly protein n=1 Tax=Pseudoalteromonas spongiae TaxID=298657 RepID=UPI000C2D4D48|nr:PilC/PilY family type IV pilus protein [Pseudoalteromonas spongiae]